MSNKKSINKNASKKTKDAVAFYKGKKSAVDLLEDTDGRKKLHIGRLTARNEERLVKHTANNETAVLVVAVIAISALALWFMVGSRG